MRKLHIGGEQAKEGWEILNIKPGYDHEGNAADLGRFTKQTFDEIYASHVLEHLDYMSVMFRAVREWRRVLKWGGKLYISVPDMDRLCEHWLKGNVNDQFAIMRIMFGGHIDKVDYHLTGLNWALLNNLLERAEFRQIEKVDKFGIFDDCSNLPISLNVTARKIKRGPSKS